MQFVFRSMQCHDNDFDKRDSGPRKQLLYQIFVKFIRGGRRLESRDILHADHNTYKQGCTGRNRLA